MVTEKGTGEKYSSKTKMAKHEKSESKLEQKQEYKSGSGKGAKALLFGVAKRSVK
jgi:hypothetical protein